MIRTLLLRWRVSDLKQEILDLDYAKRTHAARERLLKERLKLAEEELREQLTPKPERIAA